MNSTRIIPALVLLASTFAAAPAAAQCFGDRTHLLPANPVFNGTMGEAAAMHGNLFIIGAPYGPDRGSAFVYRWMNGAWANPFHLQASDTTEYDVFGRGVATDGVRCLVYASNSNENPQGAAYVYRYEAGAWIEEGKLIPPDAGTYLYYSVAIHGDLALLSDPGFPVSGVYGVGIVLVYQRINGVWEYRSKFTAPPPYENRFFGSQVAMDAHTVVVGAPGHDIPGHQNAGAVFVYARNGNSIASIPTILTATDPVANSSMGRRLALDGDRIAVGAGGGGTVAKARVFTRNAGVWSQTASISSPWGETYVGWGDALDLSGPDLAISASEADNLFSNEGAVALYRLDGGVWTPTITLWHPAPGDYYKFGYSLGLDAGRLCIGVPDDDTVMYEAGSAFAYTTAGDFLISDPTDLSVAIGQPAHFSTIVQGAGPMTYRWFVNGHPVPDNLPPYVGANSAALTITSAFAPIDEVRVEVTDGCGLVTISSAAMLTVSAPPGSCPGDANSDGTVTFADITSVLTNWNMMCP